MEVLITILIVLVLLIVAGLFWLISTNSASSKELTKQSTTINLLQQQLEAIRESQDKSSQTMEQKLQSSRENIDKHLLSSKETLEKLQNQLGRLKGDSEKMLQLGADVRSLQDILKSPKLRGQLGEQSLEKILREILPANSFKTQHTFKNGKIVDCLVQMPDHSVSVDAKFPLPAFEGILKAENDDERTKLRRQFQKDITTHIDKIAADYINPDEGTLDFAMMYIPAENVYYETIIKYQTDTLDILNYALEKKVIPVSPNLLYAYLMTIVMGLRGLQIEAQAAEIRKGLGKLAGSFTGFTDIWSILGRHLRNAQAQYDEGQTKLDKYTLHIEQIQAGDQENKAD